MAKPLVGVQCNPTKRRITMGSTTDKAKGLVNEGVGKAKQGVGKATNSPGLYGEGIAQERKGETQQFAGKTKDAVKDAVDKM